MPALTPVMMARYIINSVDHQVSFPTPPLSRITTNVLETSYFVQIKGWFSYEETASCLSFALKSLKGTFKMTNIQRRSCGSQIPRASETRRNLCDSTSIWCRVQKSTVDYIGGS